MKRNWKGFVAGVLSTLVVFSLCFSAYAAMNISANTDVKLMVNGQEFKPKDANGNDVLVFEYNGTTYAPARALAEAFGLAVGYDAALQMATVDKALPKTFTLAAGDYTVGEDIAAGKYDCVAVSGSGNFMGSVASCQFGSLNEILGAAGTMFADQPTYSNLKLAAGDTLHISGDLNVKFTSK